MGLDGVELVMAVEDRFGIAIPDEDASRPRTTRDLYEYVWTRVADQGWKPCASQHAFHRLRRVAPPSGEQLHPDTALEQVFPRPRRRHAWAAFGWRTGLPYWPSLRRPTWVVLTVLVLGPAIGVAAGVAAANALLGIASGVATWFLLGWGTRPLATHFPGRMSKVGDLVRHIADQSLPPAGGWTKERVREAVRALVIAQLGLKPDYDDDADFVRDLGL